MKKFYFYQTDLGRVGIRENGKGITNLFISNRLEGDLVTEETPLTRQAAAELREYLSGQRQVFTVPLDPEGTEFQKQVWQALCNIPFGVTWSYQELANQIGNPKACRAVGMANNKNPILILVPCHRVIGADGSLTGYGAGLEVKERLLRLEGARL